MGIEPTLRDSKHCQQESFRSVRVEGMVFSPEQRSQAFHYLQPGHLTVEQKLTRKILFCFFYHHHLNVFPFVATPEAFEAQFRRRSTGGIGEMS